MDIQAICPVHTPAIYRAACELASFVTDQYLNTAARYGFGYVADDNGPDDWDTLCAAYGRSVATKAPLPVYSGASATSVYTTIGRPAVNLQFRYWHDMAHVRLNAGFTFGEERTVSADHVRAAADAGLSLLAIRLLDADTFGQLMFGREHGGFVTDQSRWAVDYVEHGYNVAAAHQLKLRREADARALLSAAGL